LPAARWLRSQAPDLALQPSDVEWAAGLLDAAAQPSQALFDPSGKAVVIALSRRSTERISTKVSTPSCPTYCLASMPSRTSCQSRAPAMARAHLRNSLLDVSTK